MREINKTHLGRGGQNGYKINQKSDLIITQFLRVCGCIHTIFGGVI